MMTRTLLTVAFFLLLNLTSASAQPTKVEQQTILINNTQQASTNIQGQQMAKQAINNNPQADKGVLETIKDGFKRLQQSMADSNQKIKDMQIKSRENAERMKQMNDDAKAAQQRANEQIRQQQEEQRRMLDMQKSNQGGFRR